MSIFKKIFQKSEANQNHPIIDLELITKAYDYVLQEEDEHIAVQVDGIKKPVQLLFLEIPGSFDNEDNSAEMQAVNISSSFELFNTFLAKIGMASLPLDEITNDTAYNFLWIYFETKTRIGEVVEKTNHNFFVEPFIENEKIYDFGITYSCLETDNFVEKFLDSQYINHKSPQNEQDLETLLLLKKVLEEVGEHADDDYMFTANRVTISEKEATQNDFKTILQLISRNQIEENDLQKCVKYLYQIAKKEIKPEFDITNTTFDLLSELGFSVFWDYKFTASDLEFVVTELLQKEFHFEAPKAIFNADLFAFAQKKLATSNLELLELKSYADNYFFILVNKNEVPKIIELSKITKIEIGKL